METNISFVSNGGLLEGLLERVPGEKAVIVTHPHSLYGGDMYNPVVVMLCSAYLREGFTTLRFNFRGVGESDGHFADGVGEKEDVLAAIRFLVESGISEIHLAGYSFGARVLAGIKQLPPQVTAQVHIAPPLAFMDYSDVKEIPALQAVISGEFDDIAPATMIAERISTWNSAAVHRKIVGADHFFSNSLKALSKALQEVLSQF